MELLNIFLVNRRQATYKPLTRNRRCSSSLKNIDNIRGATSALPVYLLAFEEPHAIAQKKHFRREPVPHIASNY